MQRSAFLRYSLTIFVFAALLSPTAVMAMGDGKKHFKIGMKHEAAEEWDKAVEAYTISVSENPKNPEYRLHLRRALFNASQMYMKLGRNFAEAKDYESAYIHFRKAFAYDPVNELAKSEMARMVRLQEELKSGRQSTSQSGSDGATIVPTGYAAANGQAQADNFRLPQKLEKIRDLPFPSGIPLQQIVKDLARDLELNVLFDVESRLENRSTRIDLRQVTPAKALDYIFLQENLFFQRVGPRTILVASGNRRQNFQQLVLRTFYLANASPKDVKTVIQTAIPPQPGRSQTIVLEDAATNSVTVRDTEENVRLIGRLISSLDKDRAEVVMDVAIYEVSKSDLLRLGNQIGTEAQLTNLGGTTNSVVGLGGNTVFGTLGRAAADIIPSVFGAGIVLPAANLIAFQNKGNTKLLASTQIHAFNNEDSSARIGQRVPVRTAQFVTGGNQGGDGVVSNVINYEQVGLTLKFKPIVFPNQDVQVAMEIESKDVVAGGTDNNPIFSERSIKGTARVQNNRTLLLASVAQDVESRGRQGLPLLGLIPILGRLFTAPTRDNRQVDIVIAVTPRVIRAPAILPEDEVERPTGSIAVPTSGSLEAMIIQEERDEYLASIRRLPKNTTVQLPDQPEVPAYVPSSDANAGVTATPPAAASPVSSGLNLQPIDTSVKTLNFTQTADRPSAVLPPPVSTEAGPEPAALVAELQLPASLPTLKAGEKTKIAVMINSSASFRSALMGLRFDDKKLAIRSVAYGDVFGPALANNPGSPFLNKDGKMYITLAMPDGVAMTNTGILAFVEVEALTDGQIELSFEKDALNVISADSKNFAVKF
jgi:general secretion pathway protein D